MVITSATTASRMTRADAETLKSANRVSTFKECGWFNVMGFKDGRTTVNAFCNDVEEFDRLMSRP